MKEEKVAIYIDGGNIYKRLKNLGIPEKSNRFDFSSFVKHLVGCRNLISKRYYWSAMFEYPVGSPRG